MSDQKNAKSSQPEELDKQLREILNCQCWFNETYDGKAYNLKTEKYEDCSCVKDIDALTEAIHTQVVAAKKASRLE